MSQPPNPPQGGNEPGGEQPAENSGWGQSEDSDEPTRQFGQPPVPSEGQRNQTQEFPAATEGRAGETRQIQPGDLAAAREQFGQQPPYGQQPPGQQPPYGQQPPGQPGYGQQPEYGAQ